MDRGLVHHAMCLIFFWWNSLHLPTKGWPGWVWLRWLVTHWDDLPASSRHAMCPCSPSSTIWYWPKGGDAPQLGRSGVALAMSRRLSGLSIYGLNRLHKREMSTLLMHLGARHSGNVICSINEVTLRQAELVLV